MNHQEIKDLLPLYVLGGLDKESVAAVERHLAEPCDSCPAELREWREVAGVIPLGLAPTGPSTAVKERLMARVRQDLSAKVAPFRPRHWRPVWAVIPLAVAATVLLTIGGLRYREAVTQYQEAVRMANEQSARAETVAALLKQEQEKLASRETEIQRLNTRLQEQQTAYGEKDHSIAQLEASLAEQRGLVFAREQELARLQTAIAMREQELAQVHRASKEGQGVVAAYEREIASLKEDLTRTREAVASSERELRELRTALDQQRMLVAASTREVEQLREALARQRGVIEVLTSPGLRVGYLHRAKLGVETQGHVLWNERKKAWLFYTFNVPQPPAGKEYQVWFMTEKEGPVSAGLFTPDQNGTGQVLAAPPSKLFGKITAAAVTLEPAGGLPKPSGEMYLRGSL